MASPGALHTQITDLRAALSGGRAEVRDPTELVDLISGLEELKSAACAAQARLAVAFAEARGDAKVTASEVALARKTSPHRGRALTAMAHVLCREMPCTLDRLTDGSIDEHKALLLVRETACLDLADRQTIDATLCGNPVDLDGVGVRELERRVKQLTYELAPAAFLKRRSQAEIDRHLTLRPAPDAMTYLTALLPVEQGVAAWKALTDQAAARTVTGDPRSKGPLMADLLVHQILGLAATNDSEPPVVPVCVNITLPATTLAGDHAPALVEGHPLPAETARLLASRAISSGVGAWFRKLYEHDGRLIAMTSRSRFHADGLADFLDQRDQGICRTPYCDAPLRHHDHIQPASDGGPTSADNGQGLCVHCNQTKELAGWRQRVLDGRRHLVETTTPTGHTYRSIAPPLRPEPIGVVRPRADVVHPQGVEVRLATDFPAA